MAYSGKDSCWLMYADHLNHDILDDCLMKTRRRKTMMSAPHVRYQFPRYHGSNIIADPFHSVMIPAYRVNQKNPTTCTLTTKLMGPIFLFFLITIVYIIVINKKP